MKEETKNTELIKKNEGEMGLESVNDYPYNKGYKDNTREVG